MSVRILDVINISNLRNPQADSGVRLQSELLRAILRKRPDFFFYVLIPDTIVSAVSPLFDQANIRLIPTGHLTRQQGGAYHCDFRSLSESLDLLKIDIDVLFMNQPELTAAFLDYFNKVHFFDVHSVGYIHWMDWRRQNVSKARWNMPGNLSAISSILLSAVTGCNSEFGRQRILHEASRWFNTPTLEEIASKLVALTPGIDTAAILRAKTRRRSNRIKTIIFPCRTQTYTGFKSLVRHLVLLWTRRRDFRLILTNPSNYDYVKRYPQRYPFVAVHSYSRDEYLRALWNSDIVVASHTTGSQWSLAVVEAIAADCIPLVNQESFLPDLLIKAVPGWSSSELAPFLYYRSTFARQLERLLDAALPDRRRAKRLSEAVRRHYDWASRADDWIGCLEIADRASQRLKSQTGISRTLDRLIKERGVCSKEMIVRELGWHAKSRHISWTQYRHYLRERYWENPASAVVTFANRPPRRSR